MKYPMEIINYSVSEVTTQFEFLIGSLGGAAEVREYEYNFFMGNIVVGVCSLVGSDEIEGDR